MQKLTRLTSSLAMTLAVIFFAIALAIAGAVFGFGMSTAGAVAFYFVVWWTVLFVTLPVAIRSPSELGIAAPSGVDRGAPVSPHIRERAVMTTFLADIVFLISILILPLAGL